jgi:hypothetical protein
VRTLIEHRCSHAIPSLIFRQILCSVQERTVITYQAQVCTLVFDACVVCYTQKLIHHVGGKR